MIGISPSRGNGLIDISSELFVIICFGSIIGLVITGIPLFIAIGGTALVMGFLLFGEHVFSILQLRMYALTFNYILLAVPLFIFMGIMLEKSGTAEKLYEALYLWLSGFRGGLAVVTVLVGTILAACTGVIAASVIMLTVFALPSMVRRGYSKSLACGAVCAGGTLGILIPPSIMLVIYGPMANISVGKLFMAAFIPGFTLSALYCGYIAIRSYLQPKIAPTVPEEERMVPFSVKTKKLLVSVVPVAAIILSVLGVIFFGIAPPTDAAACGALAATLLTVVYRQFSWKVLKEAVTETMLITSLCFIIGACSFAFVGVFLLGGGGNVVEAAILGVPGGRWASFAVIMFIFFLLGFFIDFLGILFIMVPVLSPLGPILGFDPLWFAMMVCVNLQMSFMTPPFAPAIFYVRGAVEPSLGVTMGDIIRGVAPFVGLIVVGLGLCIAFPQLILWLPGQMIK